jgi:hypothetical protein
MSSVFKMLEENAKYDQINVLTEKAILKTAALAVAEKNRCKVLAMGGDPTKHLQGRDYKSFSSIYTPEQKKVYLTCMIQRYSKLANTPGLSEVQKNDFLRRIAVFKSKLAKLQ